MKDFISNMRWHSQFDRGHLGAPLVAMGNTHSMQDAEMNIVLASLCVAFQHLPAAASVRTPPLYSALPAKANTPGSHIATAYCYNRLRRARLAMVRGRLTTQA